MTPENIANLILSIVSMIGAGTSIYLGLGQRKKTLADTEHVMSERKKIEDEITERVLSRANAEMDKMSRRIDRQAAENRHLRRWVELLCVQVVSYGGVPVSEPQGDFASDV